MATFVKLPSGAYINLDRVTSIEEEGNQMLIFWGYWDAVEREQGARAVVLPENISYLREVLDELARPNQPVTWHMRTPAYERLAQ